MKPAALAVILAFGGALTQSVIAAEVTLGDAKEQTKLEGATGFFFKTSEFAYFDVTAAEERNGEGLEGAVDDSAEFVVVSFRFRLEAGLEQDVEGAFWTTSSIACLRQGRFAGGHARLSRDQDGQWTVFLETEGIVGRCGGSALEGKAMQLRVIDTAVRESPESKKAYREATMKRFPALSHWKEDLKRH
jgi:hypothetical protein